MKIIYIKEMDLCKCPRHNEKDNKKDNKKDFISYCTDCKFDLCQ